MSYLGIDPLTLLLSPVDPAAFFDRIWGQSYCHVEREEGYYDAVVRVDDLDEILQSRHLPAAYITVVRNGVASPLERWSQAGGAPNRPQRVAIPERLFALYREGSTIVLNGIHACAPRPSAFCRSLKASLGMPCFANAYITPPNAQGFSRHADEHEVLVLQIEGSKLWRVYPENGEPCEIELTPGSLLYLPRGLQHEAETRGIASIHITLGISPVYAFQLLEEIAAIAHSHPKFQYPLGGGKLIPTADAKWQEAFVRDAAALMREMTPSELYEHKRASALEATQEAWTGRLTDLTRLAQIRLDTKVVPRQGMVAKVELRETTITAKFAGKSVTGPVFLKSSFDVIVSGREFTVREIPGMIPDSGKIELVRNFVKTGYLSILDL